MWRLQVLREGVGMRYGLKRRIRTPSPFLLPCFPYMRAEVYFLDSWIEPEKLQIDPESFQIPGQDEGGVIGWKIGISWKFITWMLKLWFLSPTLLLECRDIHRVEVWRVLFWRDGIASKKKPLDTEIQSQEVSSLLGHSESSKWTGPAVPTVLSVHLRLNFSRQNRWTGEAKQVENGTERQVM